MYDEDDEDDEDDFEYDAPSFEIMISEDVMVSSFVM